MSLTKDEVTELLKRVRYKPGWQFIADNPSGGVNGVFVQAIHWAQNSYGPGTLDVRRDMEYVDVEDLFRKDLMPRLSAYGKCTAVQELIQLQGRASVPRYVTEDTFFEWLRCSFIQYIEEHESDEWFRVDGKVVLDPHATKLAGLTKLEGLTGAS